MSADDHRQAFLAFVAGLLGDFDRYLARGDIDLLRDGASYRMAGLWLDDAEYAELLRELHPGAPAQAGEPAAAGPASGGSSGTSCCRERGRLPPGGRDRIPL